MEDLEMLDLFSHFLTIFCANGVLKSGSPFFKGSRQVQIPHVFYLHVIFSYGGETIVLELSKLDKYPQNLPKRHILPMSTLW